MSQRNMPVLDTLTRARGDADPASEIGFQIRRQPAAAAAVRRGRGQQRTGRPSAYHHCTCYIYQSNWNNHAG